MSTTKKKKVEIPVETVENLIRMLEYCSQTIDFWELDKEWPTNLIKDNLDQLELDFSEFVSRGNINDK